MNEFLKLEYEQCLSLIRYYDERHLSLVKFSAALGSGVGSVILAVYKLGIDPHGLEMGEFWTIVAVLTGLSALSLLIVFTVLVEIRLYFIKPVRQVNSIRNYQLGLVGDRFENYMYTNSSFPTFRLFSSQTLLMLFVAGEIGVFFGLTNFAIRQASNLPGSILASFEWAIATTLAIFLGAAMYLSTSPHHPND